MLKLVFLALSLRSASAATPSTEPNDSNNADGVGSACGGSYCATAASCYSGKCCPTASRGLCGSMCLGTVETCCGTGNVVCTSTEICNDQDPTSGECVAYNCANSLKYTCGISSTPTSTPSSDVCSGVSESDVTGCAGTKYTAGSGACYQVVGPSVTSLSTSCNSDFTNECIDTACLARRTGGGGDDPETPSSTPNAAPTSAPTSSPSGDNPCFAKDTTTACKLLDAAASPPAAYSACYDKTEGGAAARVLMASLGAGDKVLTTSKDGALAKTTVVVNHHASADHTAKMLTLTTAEGATLSVTPDHAIFVDGALAAASEAKVGATLTRADGAAVKITRVAEADAAAVISPVTTSGTILASDADSRGAPLLASSHLMIFAPLYKYAASRAVISAALYVVGDVTNWTAFGATLLAKIGATLAVVAMAAKALRLSAAK